MKQNIATCNIFIISPCRRYLLETPWTVMTIYLLNAWLKVNYAGHSKYSVYIVILQ